MDTAKLQLVFLANLYFSKKLFLTYGIFIKYTLLLTLYYKQKYFSDHVRKSVSEDCIYLFQFLSMVGSLAGSNFWSIKRIQTPRPPLS